MAGWIPDAKLATVESGGHTLLGQEETVRMQRIKIGSSGQINRGT